MSHDRKAGSASKAPTRRRLTKAEMDTVKTAADRSWDQAVIAVFGCFGVDMDDRDAPRIKAWDYAIPSDQWRQIGEWCTGTTGSEIGRVNHLFDWMNYGPSAYEPEGES